MANDLERARVDARFRGTAVWQHLAGQQAGVGRQSSIKPSQYPTISRTGQ